MQVFFHQLPRLAAWMALAAALVALAVAAAAHTLLAPRPAAWADMLTPFSGHIVIGGIGAALAVMSARYALPILGVSVVFAVFLHPALHFARHAPVLAVAPAIIAPHGLRVYAHNTWDHHPDLQQLETALRAIEADVLVLTEVDPSKQELMTRLAARYPHRVSCAHRGDCATAILSRFPILAGGADRPHANIPPVAWARIDATELGLGLITVVGTHVHRPTRNPVRHRRQMLALTELILQTKGPTILAGDFNASPWSAAFRDLVTTTRLEPASALLPTWPMVPVALPQFAIDHILVSADLVVTRSGAAPATGSDHAALFAEIGLKDAPKREGVTTTALNAAP